MGFSVIKYKPQAVASYKTDQGKEVNFNPIFRAPSDFSAALIIDILACMDCELREDTVPCSEQGATDPRRLVFVRSNGNTFSLIAPRRENVKTYAQCMKDLLAPSDYPIICVKLEGEHSGNILPELDVTPEEPTFAPVLSPPPEAGYNAYVYTGVMKEYKTDATYGSNILMPFRSQTNILDAPYSPLSDYFDSCVNPTTKVICGGKTPISYRRYIATFLTQTAPQNDPDTGEPIPGTEQEAVQTVTVPVKGHLDTDIQGCGATLGGLSSVVCLEYFGESNDRLHKLLT